MNQVTMSAKPKPSEVDAEVERLSELLSVVPTRSFSRDDNRAAIRAQLRVLRERMTYNRIPREYEGGDVQTLNAALDAGQWLEGDGGPPPSEDWRETMAGAIVTVSNVIGSPSGPCSV